MKILKFTVISFIYVLVFACSSDLETVVNQESEIDALTVKTIINTSELSGFADGILIEIFNSDESGKSARKTDCYTSETNGLTTTLTFTNCVFEGNDAVNGSIRAEYILDGNDIGLKITYIDLSVGNNQISGTRKMYFDVSQQMGQTSILVESDVQIGLEDGTLILEEGSKVIWYDENTSEGQKITIDGEWTVTSDGRTFNVIIEENLETILPCEYIGKGRMVISENESVVSIDFGNGECDDMATFTAPNGDIKVISLRY